MRSFVQIIFAVVFCFVIFHSNVQGHKGAGNSETFMGEVPQSAKVSSTVPAKALTDDVKNSIATIRSFTGLTKDAFEAKMKSMGFAPAADEIGMSGQAYKSKTADYMLAVKYGTRGKSEFVREVYKGMVFANPNFTTQKTTFLDLGKQCSDLKAKYSGGLVKGLNDLGNVNNLRTEADRTSKFLPAFDKLISTKDDGGAVDGYAEKDYEYIITYRYTKAYSSAVIIIHIIDKTLVSKVG